ncbi:putative lipid II flippase FtsW [Patescibacteria group bacterium]|nr:putative lipid II flippase FtsW [Candidatus Falkowbacteria bacterium]MBU3905907.1 putative lipid II flippase FtsW [Patescibacteria group bacterium]MBU4014727.1 putative lipid II flippase FtsW [Patescibacteria group bacterium]MBU4026698.1 putative lipid II flippase FtsW [Patescibacteria group bacterium]MBU4072971.1 putative lipid II flippase FtsW [Patescibacteria group bacterium]
MRKSLKQLIQNIFSAERNEHEPDRNLIITIGIIVVFGLVMLSSASSVVAYAEFGDSYHYLKHQLVGLALGVMAFFFFSRVDYHRWRKYAFGLLIFSVFLLSLVFVPGLGKIVNGSRSWIEIFGQSLQPSEFVKLSFLLYLAAWLESRGKNLADFHQGIGPFIIVLGVIAGLMLLQPDIGTLSIVAATSLIVYFAAGGKIRHILTIILLGVLAFAALAQAKPYQMDRFRCMMDPQFSSQDACYQINQSLIAIGSGGIWGRGLGASRQKYMYLPEVSGDSIFAIIGEETGLIFSGALIMLYIYLFYRGYLASKYAPDGFGRILAIGIVSWIVLQAMINIGGMLNVLPMTGVPLPLVSYGGSAIMACLAALGILVNISKQTRQ